MNFSTFNTELQKLEKTIKITSPVTKQVQRVYWGAPPAVINDLPAIINTLTEPERVLGFGSRAQNMRIIVQLLAAKARPEDTTAGEIATALWFAARDVFDKAYTISGTTSFATLQGADPTVPVILTHADMAYVGFNAYLIIKDVEAFAF